MPFGPGRPALVGLPGSFGEGGGGGPCDCGPRVPGFPGSFGPDANVHASLPGGHRMTMQEKTPRTKATTAALPQKLRLTPLPAVAAPRKEPDTAAAASRRTPVRARSSSRAETCVLIARRASQGSRPRMAQVGIDQAQHQVSQRSRRNPPPNPPVNKDVGVVAATVGYPRPDFLSSFKCRTSKRSTKPRSPND